MWPELFRINVMIITLKRNCRHFKFFNTLRPEQTGQHSTDNILIFVSENLYV